MVLTGTTRIFFLLGKKASRKGLSLRELDTGVYNIGAKPSGVFSVESNENVRTDLEAKIEELQDEIAELQKRWYN